MTANDSPRILIISSGPACRNPRPLKEALTLAGAGFRVTLLTVLETEADCARDERLLARTSVRLHTLRTRAGLGGFLQRLRTWCARRTVLHTGWGSPESLGPAHALLAAARRHEADLTIVHAEVSLWVGYELIVEGRRVAADFEDWHSEDLLPEDRRGRPLRLIRNLEAILLRRACYTTTTSNSLARALAAVYGATQPIVLSNSFPLQPPPPARPPRDPEVVWFSQTIGPGRGLEQFLATWRRLLPPRGRLTFVGRLLHGFDRILLDTLPADLQARITFLASVAPDELPGLLARFDVGLALEPRTPRNKDLTISNKILQYLNAGLAVLATPTTGQQEVLAAAAGSGIAIDFGSPGAVLQLATFLSDEDSLRRAQIAARSAAETRFCWEREATSLIELVNAAIARNR